MRSGTMRPSGRVLVLGKDTRGFLSVIRSLGRQGLEVHVAWCDPRSPAVHSRYVHTRHDIPPPSVNDPAWSHGLRRVLERESFDLVVPCNDPSIIPLQLHKPAFAPFLGSIYLLDDSVFRIVFDKHESYDLARSLGIPVARRVRIARLDELAAVCESLVFPVLVKPRASFTADCLESKHHVAWARTPRDVERHVRALLPWGEVGVEERFPGRGVGVEVLASEGRLLVAFQHERLHEPPAGGGSSYRRSTPVHPQLLDATERFLGALRYTGVAMMEFRRDPQSGRWIFIEINGRFWGSLPLALAAGVDFPYYLYQMWVEGRRDFPEQYRTGVYCRNLLNDLKWLRKNLRSDPSDPSFAPVPWWRLPAELGPLLTLREHFDTLVLDDPRPGLAELGRHALPDLATMATRLRFSRRWWWRRRAPRARRALRQARRVLFVCKGNICRSPFAHRLAEAVWPSHLQIASCGYHPEPGRRSPAAAVQVAAAMGVDLRPHRSRVVSRELLAAADVVFVFDEHNYVTLRERYRWAMPKVHVLGVLGGRSSAIIRDPSGGTSDDFRHAYETIRRSVVGAFTEAHAVAAPISAASGTGV